MQIDYLNGLDACLHELDLQGDVIEEIVNLIHQVQEVYIIGNGGSAATASHFAIDLSKKGINAQALTDPAQLTAYANDQDYSEVFTAQLANKQTLDRSLLIAFSVSGNSPNIVKALEYANAQGIFTVAIVGSGGGKVKGIADQDLILSSSNYGQVEDVHLALCHIIAEKVSHK